MLARGSEDIDLTSKRLVFRKTCFLREVVAAVGSTECIISAVISLLFYLLLEECVIQSVRQWQHIRVCHQENDSQLQLCVLCRGKKPCLQTDDIGKE